MISHILNMKCNPLKVLCFGIALLFSGILSGQKTEFESVGKVTFVSEAPLERIEAASKNLKGILQPESKAFAFSVAVNSFQGFNSDVQRTHFLENYMLEKKFPTISFKGKWIESIDLDSKGIHNVRAKGILSVHGVPKERIINGKMEITDTDIVIRSDFQVPLADHDIKIPKVVYQKISDEINISMEIRFKK